MSWSPVSLPFISALYVPLFWSIVFLHLMSLPHVSLPFMLQSLLSLCVLSPSPLCFCPIGPSPLHLFLLHHSPLCPCPSYTSAPILFVPLSPRFPQYPSCPCSFVSCSIVFLLFCAPVLYISAFHVPVPCVSILCILVHCMSLYLCILCSCSLVHPVLVLISLPIMSLSLHVSLSFVSIVSLPFMF